IMIWALFSSISILILITWKYKMAKKDQADLSMKHLGLNIGWKNGMKNFILSIIIFGLFFGVVFTVEYLFNVNFKLWILGIFTFNPDKLLVWMGYLPFFFIFYLTSSLFINKLTFS